MELSEGDSCFSLKGLADWQANEGEYCLPRTNHQVFRGWPVMRDEPYRNAPRNPVSLILNPDGKPVIGCMVLLHPEGTIDRLAAYRTRDQENHCRPQQGNTSTHPALQEHDEPDVGRPSPE